MRMVSKIYVLLLVSIFAFTGCEGENPFGEREGAVDESPDAGIVDIVKFGSEPNDFLEKSGEYSTEFPSTLYADSSLMVSADLVSFSQNVVMENIAIDGSNQFQQVDRVQVSNNLKQGSTVTSITEIKTQENADKILDVVVVIDNSGSMSQEQENLSSKLSPLLSKVSDSDWRISVINTDSKDPCQVTDGLIQKSDSDPENRFANAIQQGIRGSHNEQGIRRAVTGLQPCFGVPSWVRNDSHVAVIIVSDEDNCSNGFGCGADAWNSEDYLLDYLNSIRVAGQNAKVYGLFKLPGDTSCTTSFYEGNTYNAAVAATDGHAGSICDADYSSTLNAISNDISLTFNKVFSLEHTPNPSSLKVFIDGIETSPANYSTIDNVVTFKQNPPTLGASIRFEYNYPSAPVVSTFDLTKNPDINTAAVHVNGVQVDNYTINGKVLTFNTPPEESADILVQYRVNTPLTKQYNIAKNAYDVSVKVNNVANKDYTYVASTGKINFSKAPEDNASVTVSYLLNGGPRLNYNVNLDDWVKNTFSIKDLSTGEEMSSVVYEDGLLKFEASQWAQGKVVELSSTIRSPGESKTIELPHTPLNGQVSISGEGLTCSTADQTASVTGNVLNLDKCPLETSLSDLAIAYEYVSEFRHEFQLPPEALDDALFRVFDVKIDGAQYSNYTVEDSKLIIEADKLPVGSSISLNVIFLDAVVPELAAAE